MSESLFRGVCDGGEIMEVRFIGLADRCCDEARSCIWSWWICRRWARLVTDVIRWEGGKGGHG